MAIARRLWRVSVTGRLILSSLTRLIDGLSFMGKAWDKAVPSVDIWKECLRVLKPGAFAFVMCIPRQDCLARMIVNLEDAGFEVGFSFMAWAFASGFPKAMSMSKAVDKRLGAKREVVGQATYTAPDIRGNSYDQVKVADRERLPLSITLPATAEAQALDGSYSNFEPKPAVECIIVAQKPDTRKYKRSDVYAMLEGQYDYWYTARTEVKDETEADKKAKVKLEKKWGRAFEAGDVIERRLALIPELNDEVTLNRNEALWSRPFQNSDITSTITAALDNGKGVTWLDEGRIPYQSDGDFAEASRESRGVLPGAYFGNAQHERRYAQTAGRFPANLLVSDDALNDGRDTKSPHTYRRSAKSENQTAYSPGIGEPAGAISRNFGDSGSFSRYFSLDQWWQAKLSQLPESAQRTFPFLVTPKAAKKEKNLGCEGLPAKAKPLMGEFGGNPGRTTPKSSPTARPNYHPTVKPLKLMSYLITLGSRPGDLVLDPFAGTCTTAMAAKMLGRDWLMIEIGEEWCKIGGRRVGAVEERLL